MANTAAIQKKLADPLVVETIEKPKLGPSDLLIKNHAIALNPADWKMRDHGYFVKGYPLILGSDIAGTVEDVGSAVKNFKEGDRVSAFADVLISADSRNGAFQQYSAVKDIGVTKLPEKISFEQGATLPMQVATAGMGIFTDLGIPEPPAKQEGGILVWGASSSVGSGAVQILSRIGYTVYAVCSPRHHDYVKSLGASATFDYNDGEVAQNIIKSAKSSGQQIKLAYDAISEAGSSPLVAEVLEAFGGGKLVTVQPYPGDPPKSVQSINTFAARYFTDLTEQGYWLFGQWLPKALADGTFVPSPPVKKIEGGLAVMQDAVETLKKGVSGQKLVVML